MKIKFYENIASFHNIDIHTVISVALAVDKVNVVSIVMLPKENEYMYK